MLVQRFTSLKKKVICLFCLFPPFASEYISKSHDDYKDFLQVGIDKSKVVGGNDLSFSGNSENERD